MASAMRISPQKEAGFSPEGASLILRRGSNKGLCHLIHPDFLCASAVKNSLLHNRQHIPRIHRCARRGHNPLHYALLRRL
jgi:hypothetical protein